ncbi:ribonuclease E/G [Litoreibacter arenae]|uniref:Ribonuclease, Rne/Rng family n=1 Tax=Litoreibacter arenae DSM 19593 TaxID=1123360 RepID=S9QN72_9RHOB|nr:ribonuclease E/G [Litoreibacter arenae]EPX81132.1 Ribonuclease, Rne/Rng family [Litoreibacter arenae DSM 19593]
MKGALIVLGELAGRQAAARIVDGKLDDLLLAPDDDAPPAPGAIFRAVADRPLKGQGGMMLALPDGQTALFRGAKGLKPGTTMLVQVTSYSEAHKAVPVTDRLIFKGRSVIVTPGAKGLNVSRQVRDDDMRETLLAALHRSRAPEAGHGVILRTGAVGLDADDIAEEADSLLDLTDAVLTDADGPPELLVDAPGPHDLAWRDWPHGDGTVEGFEAHGVLDALAALDSDEVSVGQGAMFIEPTRALVAVDVNTGGDFSPAAGLKVNLAAAKALPRQLRLRGLGGQITLDLAPMPKKDRKQFELALRNAFRADPIETSLVGWTPLGHFELQRKRERMPLPKGLV